MGESSLPLRLTDTGVNFAEELDDTRRDTRRLPHAEYLRLAMLHRFCLVAPGATAVDVADTRSTDSLARYPHEHAILTRACYDRTFSS